MKIFQREKKIHRQIQMIILHFNRILMIRRTQNLQINTKMKHSMKHSMKYIITMRILKMYSNQHLNDE